MPIVDRPVVVEWWHNLPWGADCCRYRDKHLIRVSRWVHGSLLRDILAHEWAHAHAWHREKVLHGHPMFDVYCWTYRILIDGWRPKRPLRQRFGARRRRRR